MSKLTLPPKLAARLAKDVYATSEHASLNLAFKQLNADYQNQFTFGPHNLLKGKTGTPTFIKCRTAFGFCLLGQGVFKGHAFIVFRGTKYLADWLTNVNVGISRSAFHQPVHDGFNQAFNSMRPRLEEFVKTLHITGIAHVHCIGHSLGGALATLCGEWLKADCGFKPHVYTFGSPRVGLKGFSHTCTSRLGCERIYRAYHKTDIVPYIPIWPFVHTPDSGADYYLPSPGLVPGAEYHSMDRYINSVANRSWKALGAIKAEVRTEAGIMRWLKEDTLLSGPATAMGWLTDALLFVLKKCLKGAEWIISAATGTVMTLTDQIAYILHKGIDLAKNISIWVLYLIKKILRFFGYAPQVEAAELTLFYIQKVMIQLNQRLNMVARKALSEILVQGRAI